MGCPCSQRIVSISPPIVLFISLPLVPHGLAEIPSQSHWCPPLRALQRVWVPGPPLPICSVGYTVVSTLCITTPLPCACWYMQSNIMCASDPLQPPLHPASEAHTPKCTSVPQVDGPPESPALHGDTNEN